MITLQPLSRNHIDRVAHLILTEPQYPFVGKIAELTAERDDLTDFHCALRGPTYVGFFKIDRDISRKIDRLPAGTLGFRGLLIGGQYQKAYPGVDEVWSFVDIANTLAIHCYEKTGWSVSGPGREGRSGPEQIMRMQLK